MGEAHIQDRINAIVQGFDRNTTRDEAHAMMREAQAITDALYRKELGVAAGASLEEAASKDPGAIHRITTRDFGFEVYEQPDYGQIDDYAWEFSQRYTTLEGVTLPDNAVFYTSDRKEVSRADALRQMDAGGHHLFDIALSNEYVLLREDEEFSVRDIEKRFSTNNEHLPPQSGSRRDGNTKVFKSDPRAIVISYMETNGERGHLQVIFRDEQGKPIESIAMHRRPGARHSEMTRQSFDASGKRGERYVIGPEDAPYYAYALALTHYANGFNEDMKKNWFDRSQAQEVANMLRYLGKKEVEAIKEPVIRDILGDAMLLKGNINPVPLLPNMFAAALEKEIAQSKFRESMKRRGKAPASGFGQWEFEKPRQQAAPESFAQREEARLHNPQAREIA